MDVNYLMLRQQVERSHAATATSEVARRIHEQLASEYERMIEEATGGRVTFAQPTRDSASRSPARTGQQT